MTQMMTILLRKQHPKGSNQDFPELDQDHMEDLWKMTMSLKSTLMKRLKRNQEDLLQDLEAEAEGQPDRDLASGGTPTKSENQ